MCIYIGSGQGGVLRETLWVLTPTLSSSDNVEQVLIPTVCLRDNYKVNVQRRCLCIVVHGGTPIFMYLSDMHSTGITVITAWSPPKTARV